MKWSPQYQPIPSNLIRYPRYPPTSPSTLQHPHHTPTPSVIPPLTSDPFDTFTTCQTEWRNTIHRLGNERRTLRYSSPMLPRLRPVRSYEGEPRRVGETALPTAAWPTATQHDIADFDFFAGPRPFLFSAFPVHTCSHLRAACFRMHRRETCVSTRVPVYSNPYASVLVLIQVLVLIDPRPARRPRGRRRVPAVAPAESRVEVVHRHGTYINEP
jgi:hypothetical protein